jgi:hypothetical protein
MSSSARTAATTGAATTPGACSAPLVTGGSNRHPAGRHGWSSPMPRSGPAFRSPCGHPPSRAPRNTPRHAEEASRPSPKTHRSPAGSRSGPASPPTDSGTATRPGWPRTASPRSCRTAPRPRGARHARPLRSRLRPHARRPHGRTPSPLGRLTPRTRRHPPTLARPTTRRTPRPAPRNSPPEAATGTTSHQAPHTDPGRQGEDALPNSSQPARKPRQKITGEAARKSI